MTLDLISFGYRQEKLVKLIILFRDRLLIELLIRRNMKLSEVISIEDLIAQMVTTVR